MENSSDVDRTAATVAIGLRERWFNLRLGIEEIKLAPGPIAHFERRNLGCEVEADQSEPAWSPRLVLINRQARQASVEGDGPVQRFGALRSRQSRAEAFCREDPTAGWWSVSSFRQQQGRNLLGWADLARHKLWCLLFARIRWESSMASCQCVGGYVPGFLPSPRGSRCSQWSSTPKSGLGNSLLWLDHLSAWLSYLLWGELTLVWWLDLLESRRALHHSSPHLCPPIHHCPRLKPKSRNTHFTLLCWRSF